MAPGKGAGVFQYGRHSDYRDYYWENEVKLSTVLNCHFSYVCLLNFHQNKTNIFRSDLTEFRRSFYSRSKLCQLDI